jgi:CRP-like cAMP-binding protein
MANNEQLADTLAGFALFSDLTTPQLLAVAEIFDETTFQQGEKIMRQGLTGSGFYVILEGEAVVRVNGEDRATLPRGEFFGEVSILLGESPTADVVALTPLRCLHLAAERVDEFLTRYPRIMYRMLQAQARRIRRANQWRS